MTKDIADTPNSTYDQGFVSDLHAAPADLRFTPDGIAYLHDPAQPVLAHGRDLRPGAHIIAHAHPRAQLLWAAQGMLRFRAREGVWLVPAGFGIWIPSGVLHEMDVLGKTGDKAQTRNLYIDASRHVRGDGAGCEVLSVSPLLRAVILRMYQERDPDRLRHLGEVAIDEIVQASPAPLHLPGGDDPRLRRLTAHLAAAPFDPRTLPDLAAFIGASPRTLERLFRRETGLSYREWRSRVRLLAAIDRLDRGDSSTTIAHSLGYKSASAFVAAFRTHFGAPPQSYLAPRHGDGA
jgi:AraC-like DNA-binding protein